MLTDRPENQPPPSRPDWSASYSRIDTIQTAGGPLDVWHSAGLTDAAWDDFLRGTPLGHYQQSSLWAGYKAFEGWQHHRVVLTGPAGIAGGFQILWKKSGPVRIGYVNKGPVVPSQDTGLVRQLKARLCRAARELGLAALIAQDPDDSVVDAATSRENGFIQSNPVGLIETTYLIDVRADMEVVRSRMRQGLRRDIRKARRQQVGVREGTEADLPHFFKLMAATCARNETTPNPGSVDALGQLWRSFAPTKSVQLIIAGQEGREPAAQLNLIFGNRVTIWKEGWDRTHPEWNAGALLEDSTFEWAHTHGYEICDICAIGRATALRLLAGNEVTADTVSSRDWYNVRFGGYPKILPASHVYLPNPVLRWGYRNVLTRFARFR